MTADPGASTIPGSTRGAFRFPWLLPVGTGLLLAFSFPPRSVPGLGFVALAPLVLSVEGLADGQEYRAARRGLLAGVIAWGLLLPWIPSALGPVTSLAPLVYPVGVLVMASFLALFAWTTARLRHSGRVPLWMAVPVSWTGVEWLRAHLGPLSFPWLELGVSLADTPMLLAPAEVVGGRGLGFWMALTAALLVRLGSSRAGGRRGWTAQPPRLPASLAPWIPLVAVLALPALWGAWRNDSLVLEPVGRVALFQPNLSRAHTGARPAADTALARLADLVGRVPRGSIDLAVWPEGVVASDPRRDAGLSDRISSLVDQLGAPVLLGAYLRAPVGARVGRYRLRLSEASPGAGGRGGSVLRAGCAALGRQAPRVRTRTRRGRALPPCTPFRAPRLLRGHLRRRRAGGRVGRRTAAGEPDQ